MTSIEEAPSAKPTALNNDGMEMLDELQILINEKVSQGWTIYDRNCIGCGAKPLVQPPSKDGNTEGIPFCVNCKAHVITNVNMLNQVQELEDKHGDSWVTGTILIDIQSPSSSFDVPDSNDAAESKLNDGEDPIQKSLQESSDPLSNSQHTLQLQSMIQSQEKESETFRIQQLRLANQTRLQKEEALRNQRMVQMKKEEESRKQIRLEQQMEEIRISETQKMNQMESRRQNLREEEVSKRMTDEQIRSKQEEELMQRVIQDNAASAEAYAIRRDIAAKIIGSKMVQGYTLKEDQCDICEMPYMEKDGILDCVVCPVLAKKNARQNSEKLLSSPKRNLTNGKAHVASFRAQAVLKQGQETMEEIENVKQGIFNNPSVEASAKAQENRFMAMMEDAKTQGTQEAKMEQYLQEVNDQMGGSPLFPLTAPTNGSTTPRRPKIEPASNPILSFMKHASNNTLSPEEEMKIRFEEEENLQQRQQERDRLQLENKRIEQLRKQRLSDDKQKSIRSEQKQRQVQQQHSDAQSKKQMEIQTLKQEAQKAHEEKESAMKAALDAIQTTNGNHDSNQILQLEQAAEHAEQKANKASDLASSALTHLANIQKTIFHNQVDQAALSVQVEMEEAMAEQSGLPILKKPEDLNSQTSAKIDITTLSQMADRKVGEDMKQYQKATLALSLNSQLKNSNNLSDPNYNHTTPLTSEEWELLRGASRKKISKMMMDGWTMVTDYCKGNQCRYSPLMKLDGVKQCAVCGGTGTGLDGAYTNDPNKGKPAPRMSSLPNISSTASVKSITSLKSLSRSVPVPIPVPTSVKVETAKAEESKTPSLTIDTSSPPTSAPPQITTHTNTTSPLPPPPHLPPTPTTTTARPNPPPSPALSIHSLNTLSSRKSLTRTTPKFSSDEFKEKRALVSKEMGKKMLAGWNLLEKACPYCVMPLMTEHAGSEEVCVLCGPLQEKKRLEDIKQKERTQLEEQERLQLEMEQMELEKQQRMKEDEEMKVRLAEEAEEKKKQTDLKRLQEEELKTKVDAEVKKREDEIKEDLKRTEEFVRTKNHNVNDEIQRNAERARLVNERKRFADIVKEVKKIDGVRKRQEEEDTKSVDSRRSRVSISSRRSRSSHARVSKIDDGDDASIGGVSIQFPSDFDYDDEDAIRQVIAMAKLQKKSSSSPRDISSPSGEAPLPPMSISFVNKDNNSNNPPSPMALDSPRKRSYLRRSGSRTPRLPPGSASSFSSSLLRDHARVVDNNHPTPTGEVFDDEVSHMSMGETDHHHLNPPTSSTIMSSERESRRERIMNKLNSSSSSRGASPSPRMSSRRKPASPRSSSLTRISSRRSVADSNANGISSNASLTMTPTRRSSKLRTSDAGSVTSASSRKSALGDILSKIENAKAQLVKKTGDEGM